jgi:hypothetical protein
MLYFYYWWAIFFHDYNFQEGKIIRNDTIFCSTSPEDNSELPPLPYGRGGGCSCMYCAKGNFSISLQGSGLKFRKEVYILHLVRYMISDEDFMIGCYSATFCYESTNVPKFRLCPKNNQCHSVTMACKQKCLMTTNTNRNKPKLHLWDGARGLERWYIVSLSHMNKHNQM